MNEKITIRIAAALTALILVLTAVTPAYAAGDTTIPTLTAVVNNGMLTVDAADDATGISAIYVNGFEFTDLTDGSLTIRMQQYDTGYQYFTMQAKDGAGNLSEVYRVNNPYYTFPDEDNGEEVEEPVLPTDANPTKPSNAEGEVTDHVKTDNHGNKTDRRSRSSSSTSSSSSSTKSSSSSTKSSSSSTKISGVEEDDDEDMEVDSASKITAEGREFYTIMTKTGKVFYLVIDRTQDEETVHFLTDITENDLLNATEDNKPTLPQNSAVVIKDAGLADMSAGSGRDGEEAPEKEEISVSEDSVSEDSLLIDDAEEAEPEEEVSPIKSFMRNNLVLILTLGISVLAIVIYGAVKILGKDEDDDYEEDEEQEDEEDEEAYPEGAEDEEEKSSNDEFFDRADEDEREEEAPEKENTPEQAQQSSGKEEHTEEHKEPDKQQDKQPEKEPEGEPEREPERETTAEVPVYTPYPERSQAPVTTPESAQTVETVDPDEEEPEEDDQEL